MEHQRKKEVTESMKNREMGSCRASRDLSLPQATLQRYVEDRQDGSIEVIKQNFL